MPFTPLLVTARKLISMGSNGNASRLLVGGSNDVKVAVPPGAIEEVVATRRNCSAACVGAARIRAKPATQRLRSRMLLLPPTLSDDTRAGCCHNGKRYRAAATM